MDGKGDGATRGNQDGLGNREMFGKTILGSYSRMRSEGFSFYFGGLGRGWRRLRSTPLLRPQPSAKVGNKSAIVGNEVAMAVPMPSSAKAVTCGGFKRRVASFHVAGVALCDIPTCFIACRKSFSVTGALLWHGFHEDELHFSWQVPHFGDLHRHFAWQTQRFRRVVLRFFFLRIALPRLRQVVSMCKFWAGVAFCEM